eukprot:293432-Prorocentrum_minimum.AAC.2
MSLIKQAYHLRTTGFNSPFNSDIVAKWQRKEGDIYEREEEREATFGLSASKYTSQVLAECARAEEEMGDVVAKIMEIRREKINNIILLL